MCSRFVLAITWAALVGCADAQPPAAPSAAAPSGIEVVDGRYEAAWADHSPWAEQAPLRQASTAAGAYWRGQDPALEEELQVMAVAEGAFTRAGAAQQAVLYLKARWPRCCPKVGIAVIEDGRLVRNVTFEGVAQELRAVPDLDGDGRDELAYVGAFGMGGQVSRSVTLAAFRDDGLEDWGSASIYDSDCAASGQAGSAAARVLAGPGPAFSAERYVLPSCEDGAWEAVGAAEPLALGAGESAYVELPAR